MYVPYPKLLDPVRDTIQNGTMMLEGNSVDSSFGEDVSEMLTSSRRERNASRFVLFLMMPVCI